MAAAHDPNDAIQPGTVVAGRYRVERRLGEGGMGSVYLVQHLKTDERLALKLLHAAVVKDSVALERFQREARTPARIQSDHVVKVTDADVAPELGGVPVLVMEYLRGEDLDQVLTARGALPPSEVVLYLRQAARALDKAHAIGIVHRDLKPENLFLTERDDGTPCIKLLDFGIAKLTGSSGDLARHGSKTSTGQIFGTPLFMAPEQAMAESSKISPQTDVWALGLIAHKLLTGEDIWTAQNLTQLIAQIAYEPLPVPSQRGSRLGPEYDAWFAVACARDPARRFRTAGEAVSALASALSVRDVSSAPSSFPDDARRSEGGAGSPSGASAIATTSAAGTPAALLRHSAGPLTRTQASAMGATRKRSAILAMAGVGIAAGVALGLWLARDRRVAPGAPESGSAGPSAAAGPASAQPSAASPGASAAEAAGPDVGPAASASASALVPPATAPVVAPGAELPAASSASAPEPPAAVPAVALKPEGTNGALAGRAPPAPNVAAKAPASAKPAGTAAPAAPQPAGTGKDDVDPLAGRH